ncbi:acid protease [Hypoxylon crocopeplum]|nr:acid protease [Hypoxylon crocopeplum]
MKPSFFVPSIGLVAVHATPCEEIKPFQLPIRDVQVLPDIPNSFMKGIAATIGTPPQEIVLLPWPELNNTWIYDQQPYCDPTVIWNDVICRVRRGNHYYEGNSSTWSRADDVVAAGGAATETQGYGSEPGIGKLTTTSLGGTDSFAFGSIKSLADMPIGIPRLSWDHGYTMLHSMGMGTNSVIFNALLQTGQVGSRVWSIFWGRMWVDDESAVDGSIVFGGYDKQKTTGKNYTQSLDFDDSTGCWTGMKVYISRIQLNFRNGDDVDLLDPNTAISACIVPQRQLLLESGGSVVYAFEQATGMRSMGLSYGLHCTDSDLTISLSTGLDVRIPNDQYLVPYVDIDRNGSRIFNSSRRELLIATLVERPPILGRYFLTSAYLMVDLDSNTFTLWKVNPTPDSELIPVVGSRAAGTECGNGTYAPGSGGSSSNPSQNPQAPQATQTPQPSETTQTTSGLSGGSIAGIVVGTVTGLAVLGLGTFYLRRVCRRPQFAVAPITPDFGGGDQANGLSQLQPSDNNKQLHSPIHELRGSSAALSEVSGQDHFTYELVDTTTTVRTL